MKNDENGFYYKPENKVNLINYLKLKFSDINIPKEKLKEAALVIAAIVLTLGVCLFVTRVINILSEQKSWAGHIAELRYKRLRYVQQFSPVRHETWWNTIPELGYDKNYIGDRVRGSHRESYSTVCTSISTTYSDGKTTMKSSTVPCTKYKTVDDYDRWYSYTLNEWTILRVVTSEQREGRDEHKLTAVWPEIGLLNRQYGTLDCGADSPSRVIELQPIDPLLGCQRIPDHTNEDYFITHTYTIGENTYSLECSIEQESWTDLRVGKQTWGKYYVHNNSANCNDARLGVEPTATPPSP